MALEQIVKELQAQNAQFQEMFLNLAKGQEELKALINEKKKTNKPIRILNTGRKFRGPVKWAQDLDILSEKDGKKDEDIRVLKLKEAYSSPFEAPDSTPATSQDTSIPSIWKPVPAMCQVLICSFAGMQVLAKESPPQSTSGWHL